jgi:hypothetical protein
MAELSNGSGSVRRTALGMEELEGRVVPTLLGQQLFPSDYPWNQNISTAPLASNSAAVIAHIGSSIRIHPDWGDDSAANGSAPLYGIPFNVVHGNTVAKVHVTIDNYPGESDLVDVPIPANAVIEGDFQNGPNPNVGQRGDSHLLIWDEDNNVAYELYLAARPSETGSGWHAGQESVWDMKSNSFRSLGWTSSDAAGLSILAGLARPDEGLPTSLGGQGAINHAIRFTLPSGDVAPQYIYPASHIVSTSAGSTKLPFGARLRLMNTPAVNTVINGLGPQAQIIAHAMQQYGLVLADIGSAMYVTGSSASQNANNAINFTWDMNDVLGLRALTAANFEVVDLTPQVTGLSASSGTAGSTVTITGQNFSGAAGRLSVLFGTTPAASLTVMDDTHVTAVVPNGSGTVNVMVQSGIVATDPNNPNDNVKNPVFGYGTSATSAADQFTYGTGPTISGTNSTASFASPTVTSGNTDLLTILVKDTAGNAVGGLGSGAFGLSLSGGTSAGTFSAVTATATPGTYTATFTGTTAGTASTLTVTVAGVTLAAHPTVTVNPVPQTSFTVTGFPSPATAGAAGSITVQAIDQSGNPLTGYAGTVHFTSSDPQAVLPADYTFTAADAGMHIFNNVVLKTAGSRSIMVADLGTGVAASQTGIQVLASAPAVLAVVAGSGQKVRINGVYRTPFQVAVKDAFGNPVPSVTVTFTAPSAGPSGTFSGGGTSAAATTGANGTASASPFTANGTPGRFTVTATVAGVTAATFSLVNTESLYAVGADAGATPYVAVYDAVTHQPKFQFYAYATAFRGGVRVAVGDVNGDGISDVIVAAGPGGSPHVRVLDGLTGVQLPGAIGSFDAYAHAFTGGVYVAAADVNNDGFADVITGAGPGGGPDVSVFDGRTGQRLYEFYAQAKSFTGGVPVAGGDVNGDGFGDIVAGAGQGGAPSVQVFSGKNLAKLTSFFAYTRTFAGGVNVGAGDLNGDGKADIITGMGRGSGSTPEVKAFSGATGALLADFFAYPKTTTSGAKVVANTSGVRVAACDFNGDGFADVVAGPGPGLALKDRVFDGRSSVRLTEFNGMDPSFLGGVWVGGG